MDNGYQQGPDPNDKVYCSVIIPKKIKTDVFDKHKDIISPGPIGLKTLTKEVLLSCNMMRKKKNDMEADYVKKRKIFTKTTTINNK